MKKKGLILFCLLTLNLLLIGQEKFKVVIKETDGWRMIFNLVNEKEELIKQLDTSKYFSIDLNDDKFGYFAIFQFVDSAGLYAIDANENIMFKVFSRSYGMPEPDYLVESKIRIVDITGKIGFANSKGKVIIKPQYEFATSYHNGKAIVGENCKYVYPYENDSIHFRTQCESYGYIDEKGSLIKMDKCTLEEIIEEIKWVSDY